MSFPAYESYKESGEDWIGQVPAHWCVTPIKADYSIYGGATPKSDVDAYWDGDVPWVTPADLSRLTSAYVGDTLRTLTEEGLASCAATLVPAGSVILSTRAPIGSLGITERAAATNQGCKSLVARGRGNTNFFAYVLSCAKEALNVRGKGTTFLELSGDELGRFKTPAPDDEEQRAIAAFLDRETAKIDALVEAQGRLIALLKEKRQAVISHAVTKGLDPSAPMKDSGVEWLGQVPAHWRVQRIKHVAEVRGRIGFRGYTTDDLVAEGEGALALGGANIGNDGRLSLSERTYLSWPKYYESPEIMVNEGDVLLGQRGTCGKAALVENEIGPSTINPSLVVLKCNSICSKFLCSWINSDSIQNIFSSYLNKTAVPMLSQEQIRNVPIFIPPESEQKQIAAAASRVDDELQRLSMSAHAAKTLLVERRAALISAAVTGKIDVRGLVQTAEAA